MSHNTQSENASIPQEQQDLLNQLLKPEVQESLTVLVEHLPKLAEMATVLTSSYDFMKAVATDETLKNDTVSAVTEMAAPVVGTAKSLAQTAIEAKDLAEKSDKTIGLFGMLGMLKDPQVQSVLRFADSFLQVSAKHKSK